MAARLSRARNAFSCRSKGPSPSAHGGPRTCTNPCPTRGPVASTVGLVEVDSKGATVLKVEALSPINSANAQGIAKAKDGYLVVGTQFSPKSASWLLKVDGTGKQMWQALGADGSFEFLSVAEPTTGQVITGGSGVRLFSASGAMLPVGPGWATISTVEAVVPTLQGGAILAGTHKGAAAVQAFTPNHVGGVLATFGGSLHDAFLGATAMANGHIVAAGINKSTGKGFGDAWALRLDAFGNQGCAKSGPCFAKGAAACDDGSPCTVDSCSAAAGCSYLAVKIGGGCGNGKTCSFSATCE